jgi:glycosidase
MKKISYYLLLALFFSSFVLAQTVPVTFHYAPTYKGFTTLRVVGSFNGWNNADNTMKMTGPNGQGEYAVTVNLAPNTDYNYKYCMDANWNFAYGDPDNPRINAADNNNSVITVKDPMITYLLPRDIDSKSSEFIDTTSAGLPIRMVVAYSVGKSIDPAAITLSIDGTPVVNPAQYYDSTRKELIYQPKPALPLGEHTVTVSITSAAGTDTKTAKYLRALNVITYKVPVDFYYDGNNHVISNAQTLTSVSVVGTFNNWNDVFNPLKNTRGDGVWEATAYLPPDSVQYKFKLNGTVWVNDPDQSLVYNDANQNSLIIVKADSMASMKLLNPVENATFHNDTTIAFKFLLRPGAKSAGIDVPTISVLLDGTTAAYTYNAADSTVSANLLLKNEGRHTVEFSYKNKEAISVDQIFSFGISYAKKGLYIVDGIGDEQYTYPSGVAAGSADILSVSVQATAQHDSLKFAIQMRNVDERTRLGFLITNPVSTIAPDPRQLEIRLPDWKGQGVFASIGAPGNSYQNAQIENRFMVSTNPDSYATDSIYVNKDAIARKTFTFTVALSFLDRYLGGWSGERDINVFSYLAATDKSGNGYEVTPAEGGSAVADDPDVYDAAFVRSTFWQKRLLSNYVPVSAGSGAHYAALEGVGRGLLAVTADMISDSLMNHETYISFLTPSVTYWYPNVTVNGFVSDTTIQSAVLILNGVSTSYPATNGKFAIPVTLKEGRNSIFVKAVAQNNVATLSKELILTYVADNKPVVSVRGTHSGRSITLTATATSSVSETISYAWAADPANPATQTISYTDSVATFTLPSVNGQYIFMVTVNDNKSGTAIGKIELKAVGDSIYIAPAPDNYHPDWVDTMVVYEIYPRSFDQQIGFGGITANVDRIKALGVNTVWLMPIFEGPTTHGYEITDYYSLESDYGSLDDFSDMMSALHGAGIKVILDFVVNHTSVAHPFMQNVYKYKEYSPWANFYYWSGEPGNSSYQYLFDWSSMPNLNHSNPDVRKYFVDVAKYWVQNWGVDGYRCDVAWGVEQRNNQFWKEWRAGIKTINPDVYLLAEANSNDTTFFTNRFDSAYDWDLYGALKGILSGGNKVGDFMKLALRPYAQFARPFHFAENHDEVRAAGAFGAKRSELMHTLMFTLNGVPLIYSGGEVGETTQRDMINWSDPNKMLPYFKRLVSIRKSYFLNPVVSQLSNSDTANTVSYASVSGKNVIVTVGNFKNSAATITINLSKYFPTKINQYYLTDLFSGQVIKVPYSGSSAVSITLSDYQARVFYFGTDSASVVPLKVEDSKPLRPLTTALLQNYPNPFNPTTTIRYDIAHPGQVSLKLYDMLGKEVMTLVNEMKDAGSYSVSLNASRLPSGVYIYQLRTGSFVSSKKIVLVK